MHPVFINVTITTCEDIYSQSSRTLLVTSDLKYCMSPILKKSTSPLQVPSYDPSLWPCSEFDTAPQASPLLPCFTILGLFSRRRHSFTIVHHKINCPLTYTALPSVPLHLSTTCPVPSILKTDRFDVARYALLVCMVKHSNLEIVRSYNA